MCTQPITSFPWIIDSGATYHITTSNFISTLHPIAHPLSINVLTGNTVNVTSTGDVKLSSSFTLHNILFVPEFKFNLMSISQLTKSLNFVVFFYPKFFFFQDLTMKTLIGMGEERDDLYYFKPVTTIFFFTNFGVRFS